MHLSELNNKFINGEKVKVIKIDNLLKLKSEINHFKQQQKLNNFQKWIVNDLYKFDIPNVDFSIKSIILIAIPHPFYANVEFVKDKRKYNFMSLVMSDFKSAEDILYGLLAKEKKHIIPAENLPLKRLAVQSGFTVYGRNNICYINGMGSNFSFIAYYSDIACADDYWADMAMAARCVKCGSCIKDCPTGAIQKNNFLLNNERCLSYWNESSRPFPEWLPENAHHCVYDCIKCQIYCPMNKKQIKNIVGPVKFNELETNMLLAGLPYQKQSGSFNKKVKYLGLHQWPDGIPKNLKVLFAIKNSE